MNLRLYLYAGLTVAGLAIGWMLHSWKTAYDLERDRIAQEKAEQLVGEISGKTLEQIAAIRIENKTIYQQGRTEVLRETVYRDCVVPEPGRLLLESARQN